MNAHTEKSMNGLVEHLLCDEVLKTPCIIESFRATDRKLFVPERLYDRAYEDIPLGIGYLQTISQPYTVAFMLELLQPESGNTVLDIGAGSGWTTALLAHIVGNSGNVLGLERIEELVTSGTENLKKLPLPQAHIERAGTEIGSSLHAPYDRILVSAAANSFPHELLAQLKEGGTMVLPVRDAIWKVVHTGETPVIERFDGFVFVPLIIE